MGNLIKTKNLQFKDAMLVNNATYIDYLERFKKIAMSMFEWVNLPSSMNARFIEQCLYYDGACALLYDETYGYINTKVCSRGKINIYGLPTRINCYSFGFQDNRRPFIGSSKINENEYSRGDKEAILVANDWEFNPTCSTLELFAMRLFEAERACDVNIKNQKFPLVILTDDKQRLTMQNMFAQINGNYPAIFGDKNNLSMDSFKVLNTGATYVADKLTEYKKEIWNEALTFLGINNIDISKKERLITGEASSNNELINLNLQSHLAPRQEACRQFNELYGLTGTDKEISVRVRSDLSNIIKSVDSIVNDYKMTNDLDLDLEGVYNG